MTSPDTERASRVCSTCKTRKKACDKQLPICGYCTKRDLACRYDDSPTNVSGDVAPGGSTLSAWEITRIWDQHVAWNTSKTSICSLFNQSPVYRSMNLEDLLSMQLRRILQSTSFSIPEIGERFFRGFNKWLPVMSQSLFRENAAKAQCSVPPADFSILLLAMCLITLHSPASTIEHAISPRDIYLMVKLLFVHVQTVFCASTSLIQAGLLVAAYEYALGWPDTAYISIGICQRMAYTIGLGRAKAAQDDLDCTPESKERTLEGWNVWWGVVILERMILLEIESQDRQPTTEHLDQDLPLPSDLGPIQQLQWLPFSAMPSEAPLLSATGSDKVTRYGRLAQAVHLLDQVLRVTYLAAEVQSRLPELRRLDEQLQTFLTLVMGENHVMLGVHCATIGTAIRSFFLLHQDILTRQTTSVMDIDQVQWEQRSQAALDTATKIMIDVARHHLKRIDNIDALPLCCAYNLRVAMKHIEGRRGDFDEENITKCLKPMLALEEAFCKRWRSVGTL